MSDINITRPLYRGEKITNQLDLHGKDLVFLFYIMVFITIGMMATQFYIAYFSMTSAVSTGTVYQLPIETFVSGLTVFMGLFGGIEGGASFLKTASLDKGELVKLPEYKVKQLFSYIMTFLVLTLFAMILQAILQSGTPDFCVKGCSEGLVTGIIVYVIGRTGPKAAQHLDFLKKREDDPATPDVDESKLPPEPAPADDGQPQSQPTAESEGTTSK